MSKSYVWGHNIICCRHTGASEIVLLNLLKGLVIRYYGKVAAIHIRMKAFTILTAFTIPNSSLDVCIFALFGNEYDCLACIGDWLILEDSSTKSCL